ncbi:MAG: OmpA family protein, partial [Pseudomonas mandelii]
MKLKNTLGLAIGSLIAATSFGALAQGQGAVEIEGFAKKEQFDSARNFKNNGNLFGGSIGYFLTDDVELRLGYDEVHNVRSDDGRNIKGANTALDALYHFNNPGDMLR